MTRGRVLVADTDRRVRQELLDFLGPKGYQVDIAASATSALKKIEDNAYDAVFLDQKLPKVGGTELLPRILRLRPEASVLVLGKSGGAESPQNSHNALKRGAFHYLTKPIDHGVLDLVLRSCTERSRLLYQNAELQQKTIQDDLTTAFNRRYLDAYLDEELERDRRYGRAFSILFFDLDHLKEVNDRHGHLAGSRVLREVAQLIQSKLRKSDRIFRYGGDEFVVTLPETGAEGALRVAHRLRRAVRSHHFLAAEGLVVGLTASFGVATFPHDGSSQEELIRSADQAMYRVKTHTRDGVAAREM
ncbi:MAG TPA: diguanylate cyclase [Candidatus Acidoferrum sp.]|nr:diguanylate cyclase [Candidatus Acidoferrum sp.]